MLVGKEQFPGFLGSLPIYRDYLLLAFQPAFQVECCLIFSVRAW